MKKIINELKNIRRFYRFFSYGFKNLYNYFGVIWNDRQWDHAYMEEIMLVKLKTWYNEYKKPQDFSYVGIEKDLKAMRICITILERRKNYTYLDYGDEDKDWRLFCDIFKKYFQSWWI